MLWGWKHGGLGVPPLCEISPLKFPCPELSVTFKPLSWYLKAEGTKINEMVFPLEFLEEKEGKKPQTEER